MNRRDFLLGATALATTAAVPISYGAAGSFTLAEFERRYAMPVLNGGTGATPLELLMASPDHGWVGRGPVFDGEIGLYSGVKFVEP